MAFKSLDLDAMVGMDEATDADAMAETVTLYSIPSGDYTAYGSEYETGVWEGDEDEEIPDRPVVKLVFLTDDEKKLRANASWEPPHKENRNGKFVDGPLVTWGELTRAMHMPSATKREVLETFKEGAPFNLQVDEYIRALKVKDVQNEKHREAYINDKGLDEETEVYYTIYAADAEAGHREKYAALGYRMYNKVKKIKTY